MRDRFVFRTLLFCAFIGLAFRRSFANEGLTPKDVKAFIQRADECHHWAGEEPYNKDRGAEIARAIQQLQCETLGHQASSLKKKYANRRSVLTTIQTAIREDEISDNNESAGE